jgi:hypothetical protein
MSMILRQSAAVISRNGCTGKNPATLTSTSTRPVVALASAANALVSASSVMSAGRVWSRTLFTDAASLARLPSEVSLAMTTSPLSRKRRTNAAPIPPAAPVITSVLSVFMLALLRMPRPMSH